ncbi:unnamed protein product, partial [Mesorhabditis belari]|uniref:DNA 3'-5' helicase n=1 Tax=Mesorhabditis belari TaxID=2138241 RepID=A0AAF3EQE5_9BILA
MPGWCSCNKGTAKDLTAYDPVTGNYYPTNIQACYTATNACAAYPSPCPGLYAQCVFHINNFECRCPDGYTGPTCNLISTDPCDSSPCRNGATCTMITPSPSPSFTCTCDPNYTGERCQYVNTCVKNPNQCLNGGTCVMLWHGEDYYCNCTSYWQGPVCGVATLTKDDSLMDDCIRMNDWYNATKVTNSATPSVDWCRGQTQSGISAGKDYKYYCLAGKDCRMYDAWLYGSGDHCDQSGCGCANLCNLESSPKNVSYWGANQTCGVSWNGVGARGPCYEYSDIANNPCPNGMCKNGGTCRNATDIFYFECDCAPGFTGYDCSTALICQPPNPNNYPCKYGGMCIVSPDPPGYTCDCLSGYTGSQCEIPNMCNPDRCGKYGNCSIVVDSFNSTYICECDEGWTGKFCNKTIDYCQSPPCQWGGTCSNIYPPADPFFLCACQPGTSGTLCEFNPDDCPYKEIDGKWYSMCNQTDKQAQCIDGFNTWHCQCGPDYTSNDCSIPIVVYNAIALIFGPNAAVGQDIIELLKDLLSNPTNIKDMVPFVLGLETEEDRADKSWDYSDMFHWVAYEEKTLVLERDLLKWNDVTLGNCFTFNHRNNTNAQYLHRITGKAGSLEALLSVNSLETCPWVDTQAIQVFVHPAEEDIFSESVRYNAQPGGETELFPELTAYKRLGGRYGVCVNEASQVEQYFYTGSYATDGCLRSCYQQSVFERCACMDPRYPMEKGVQPCGLQDRNCVDDVTIERGDPSKWSNCTCPLPCANRAYTVSWAKTVFSKVQRCDKNDPNLNYTACEITMRDEVRVRVILSDFTFQLFAEVPAMSFNSFIGNLGVCFIFDIHPFTEPLPCDGPQLDSWLYAQILKNHSRFLRKTPTLGANLWIPVFVIVSGGDEKTIREIKDTWANNETSKLLQTGESDVFFVIGRRNSRTHIDRSIEDKILEVDVEEKYTNLLLKELVAFLWISNQLNNGYVLKVDGSDTVVAIDRLQKVLNLKQNERRRAIECTTWKEIKPIRDPCSPWYIPKPAFKWDVFPEYCSGPAYLMQISTLREILDKAIDFRPLVCEDAFFTGVLAGTAKIPRNDRVDVFDSKGCQTTVLSKIGSMLLSIDLSMTHKAYCASNGTKITAVINFHRCRITWMDVRAKSDEIEAIGLQLEEINQQIQQLQQQRKTLRDRREKLERSLVQSSSKQDPNEWETKQCEWTSRMDILLNDVFNMQSFRPLQQAAINCVLSGNDTLLLMSTGGGKSLCYQMPAIIAKGLTLVVSPLLALIEDQLIQLRKFGIEAAALNQSTTKEELRRVEEGITKRNSSFRILYVTPEKLAKSKRLMNKLEKSNEVGFLKLIAIDEVHCCSQWGHDFRPDYKFLNILKRQFKSVPILGLTATATAAVLDDVKSMLGIPGAIVFRANFNRPNLQYEVVSKKTDGESLVSLIKCRFANETGIVYCFSRKDTEDMAQVLRSHGIKASCYHAYMENEQRKKVHNAWIDGKLLVIVATVAFGMGIDKPNVRYVIHYSLPKSIENYYQESGRAGRDGQSAVCILMWKMQDMFRQSTSVCAEKHGLENLYSVVKYATNRALCRRITLSEHFEEEWDPSWCQQKCDICAGEQASCEIDAYETLCHAVDIIEKEKNSSKKSSSGRITGGKLVEMLSKNGDVRETIEETVAQLIVMGYLREDFHFTPYSVLSYIEPGIRFNTMKKGEKSRISITVPHQEKKAAKKRKLDDEIVLDSD